ncbi:MAG: hypothetical protein WD333_02430 [Dehalococcoidia bacterium]
MEVLIRSWVLAIVLFALFLVSCNGGDSSIDQSVSKIDAGPEAAVTSISLPVTSSSDRERNRIANQVVQYVTRGCAVMDLELSDTINRILAAYVDAAAVEVVNADADIYVPPEGVPKSMVWVIAIEGSSVNTTDGSHAGNRAFMVVVDPLDPRPTGCTVSEAPIPTHYGDYRTGPVEFELLFERPPA